MEEAQNNENVAQQVPQESTQINTGVSFPTVGEPKKSGSGAKTLLIVGVLVLVGILGFVIFKSASKKSSEELIEPTPFENLTTPIQDQTTTSPVPSATPITADKTKIKIQVQNGTGITGEAAYLQTQLKGLGYTSVSTGNSTKQDLTATEVSFANSLSSEFVAEITSKLKSIYQSVTTTTSAGTTYDVVVVTGLRKGATPKPSATPVTSPTPTATPI